MTRILEGAQAGDPQAAVQLLPLVYDELRKLTEPSTRVAGLKGEELTTTAKRRSAEAPKLITLLKGDLDWIAMKCLEKDRARRYETANGLALDIERHLKHEPVLARPPSKAYRLQKFVRRNKLMVTAGAAVAVALVLGVVVSTWLAVLATRALAREEAERRKAVEARAAAEAQELETRRLAYAADMNNAQQALTMNDLGRARQLLDAYRPGPGEVDLRGWEWRYLWQDCRNDSLAEICRYSNAVHSVAFSTDGKLLAVAGLLRGERVDLWALDSRTHLATLQAPVGQLVAFSPRGDLLAADGPDGEIRLYEAGSANLVSRVRQTNAQLVTLRFSPDGSMLASLGRPGGVTVWNVDDRTHRWQFPASSFHYHLGRLDFSPDNRALAIGEAAGQLRVVDLGTGALRFEVAAHPEAVSSVAWSPAGPVIATGSGYSLGQIQLWDAEFGAAVGSLEGHTSWISALVFSSDGQRLYSASADQTIRIWAVGERRCLAILRGSTDVVYDLALSPDNTTLASASKDGIVALWNALPQPQQDQPQVLEQAGRGVQVISPDSRVLAAPCNGVVTLFELPSLRTLRSIPELGTNAHAVAYSTDGALLASGCEDGMVRVWSAVEQRLLHEVSRHERPVGQLQFAGQDQRLMSADRTGNVIELDAATGRLIRSLLANTGAEYGCAALSADGRLFLSGDRQGSVHWWDLESGQWLGSSVVHRQLVRSAMFSGDSVKAATVSDDGTLVVWDAASRVPIHSFKADMQGAHSVAFSPDGRRLATGGTGRQGVKLWDLSTYREVGTLPMQGHRFAASITFSPDGHWVASGNFEGQLHLWHAPSWEEIAAAEAAEPEVGSAPRQWQRPHE